MDCCKNNNNIIKINHLPNELLEIIFKNILGEPFLSGCIFSMDICYTFNVLKSVCQIWREILQSLIVNISIGDCFRNRENVENKVDSIISMMFQSNHSLCTLPRLQSIQLNLGIDSISLEPLIVPLVQYYYKMELQSLNLSNNYLSHQSVKSLKPLITSSTKSGTNGAVTQLSISHNVRPKLKLNLSGNMLGLGGVKYISKYLSLRCNLVQLDLSNNHLNNSGTNLLLMSMIYNTTISSLNISGNYIGRDCVVFLNELFKYNQTLQYLDLSFNWIGPEGSYQIINTLLMSQHRIQPIQLNLSYNKILDEGLKKINKLLIDAQQQRTSILAITSQHHQIQWNQPSCLSTNIFPLEKLILVGNDTGSGGVIIEQIQDNLYKHQLSRQQLLPYIFTTINNNSSNSHCKV